MKKILSLLIVSMFSLSLLAETYTIEFYSGNSDSNYKTDVLSNIVFRATNNCVAEIRQAENIYRAKDGYGIKGGTTTKKGELTLGLDDIYHITSLTVYAASYDYKDDSVSTYNKDQSIKIRRGIVINGQYFAWAENHRIELYPYQLAPDANLDSISIASDTTKNNRWYVQKIEFEAENPHPTRPVMEMPYAFNLGYIDWVSEDEPLEDVIDFDITGKNMTGTISLAMKSGSKFAVTPTTLPANGGDVCVSYSILIAEAPTKAYTYTDTIIANGEGVDGNPQIRKLPIEITVNPKSSEAKAFVLDTTRIAIGPMPGNYYEYAQGTADSTLKNHLGYIICTGQRYKYGSGSKKSWDAFFHTDRDTVTNQVLDMYSNNVRYFNPEQPTASVTGFDIEHMMPKSWWGGIVNPAYCDIFHLVPGDYSANRSKSNHAPGVPADSSFYNGSFVTGKDTIHGLTRVFCPADEYKGDFARAYFYIATCYGDSLTWLETGEPSQAVTNEGWQEFRPWLRDLLLDWHRLDPVSEKEKARAIEVNKIQGNRNPFIDYPDLAEYIWGIHQGEAVDFTTLTQSYGDQYDDGSSTGVSNPTAQPTAVKKLREGQIVIIRNSSIYTTLGQTIR